MTNENLAITPCLFNAGFCGNFIIISRIKVSNILTGNSFASRAKQTLVRSDTSKPGMHCSIIQNLVRIEQGDTSFVKWHGSFDKQLEKVKYYMHKAMDKYLKMKNIPPDNLNKIELLNSKIDRANSTDDLLSIVDEAIDLTALVKIY